MSGKLKRAINNGTLSIFIGLTKEGARDKQKEWRKKLGRDLTDEENYKIVRSEARKARGKVALVGMFGIGVLSGMKGANLLNEANNRGIEKNQQEITVDLNETHEDNLIIKGLENSNVYVRQEKDFKDGLKYDYDVQVNSNEINYSEDLFESAQTEVDNLNNSQEVLDYIKQIYVNEYNEQNNTNITIDNVKLYKTRDNDLYIDEAENGDKIVRITDHYEGDKRTLNPEIGEVTAVIIDGENTITERMTYYDGKYVPLYSENENVKENKENTLTKLGGVTFNGIDYYGAFVDKEKGTYKNRFIDSVREYKQTQIDRILNKNLNEENETEIEK